MRILDGQLFVAADYVPNTPDRGNSLQAYVGCTGVPEGLLLTWLAQFCHGMAHAQFHGVVAHRDIKPGNLMLMPDNELRITDFGLARSFTLPSGTIEDAVERRSISGTLPYMAPEQFLAPGALDHRVDIYAFGVTLYELIAGVRPFAEISQQALVSQILIRAPKPLQSPLWAICERCLRKAPSTRYQTFEDLLTDARLESESSSRASRHPEPMKKSWSMRGRCHTGRWDGQTWPWSTRLSTADWSPRTTEHGLSWGSITSGKTSCRSRRRVTSLHSARAVQIHRQEQPRRRA